MSEFSGQYNATVDDKGRVVLPAAYKRELGMVADRSIAVEHDPYEQCLNLYPLPAWQERVAMVKSRLNPNDPRQSRVLDQFYQRFVKIAVAENGRLNIPNAFLRKVGIVKDVVFTGQGDRIRLWEAVAYQATLLPDEDYTSMFEEFMGGSLNGKAHE